MRERLAQLRVAFETTREADSRLVPYMAGAAAGGLAVPLVAGVLLGATVLGALTGLLVGLLGGMIVLGRRATSAQLGRIEGRPGAAAAVLNSMRGRWHVTPAVAVTRKQELVHRVVGRPGVVLVGEGSRGRVKQLLKQERRKVKRATGDVPVNEVSVGDGKDQVPLRKLTMHLSRLPRELKRREVEPLATRLDALGGSEIPMPKGPIPGGRGR